MADHDITADQKLPLSVDASAIVDQEGNPAQVENIVFRSSNEAVISIEEVDGQTFAVSHAVGEAMVSAEADADLGEGVKTLSGSTTIAVSAGQAASITINVGTAVPKDTPPPPADTTGGGGQP